MLRLNNLVGFGVSGVGDPNFADVTALLHFDGTDASTTFTDEIGTTWVVGGDAQIDTAQSKFGGASGLFDGTGDYLQGDNGSGLILGSGDWTIEFWVRFNSIGSLVSLFDARSGANGAWPSLRISSGNLQWLVNATTPISAAHGMSTGTWYHIAASKNSGSLRLFVDGSQIGVTWSDSVTYLGNTNRPILMGDGFTLGATPLNGWADDFRITKGVGRYTGSFTPPTAAFPNS